MSLQVQVNPEALEQAKAIVAAINGKEPQQGVLRSILRHCWNEFHMKQPFHRKLMEYDVNPEVPASEALQAVLFVMVMRHGPRQWLALQGRQGEDRKSEEANAAMKAANFIPDTMEEFFIKPVEGKGKAA